MPRRGKRKDILVINSSRWEEFLEAKMKKPRDFGIVLAEALTRGLDKKYGKSSTKLELKKPKKPKKQLIGLWKLEKGESAEDFAKRIYERIQEQLRDKM